MLFSLEAIKKNRMLTLFILSCLVFMYFACPLGKAQQMTKHLCVITQAGELRYGQESLSLIRIELWRQGSGMGSLFGSGN